MVGEAAHHHLLVYVMPRKRDQHGQICCIHRHNILSIDNIRIMM